MQSRQESPPVVTTVLRFAGQAQRDGRLRQLGARLVKVDPWTGLPLWKTSAGLVLRVNGTALEVLSGCSC